MAEEFAAVCRDAAGRLEVLHRAAPHPIGPPLVRLLREAAVSFEEWPGVPPAGLRGEVLAVAGVIVAADRVSC